MLRKDTNFKEILSNQGPHPAHSTEVSSLFLQPQQCLLMVFRCKLLVPVEKWSLHWFNSTDSPARLSRSLPRSTGTETWPTAEANGVASWLGEITYPPGGRLIPLDAFCEGGITLFHHWNRQLF